MSAATQAPLSTTPPLLPSTVFYSSEWAKILDWVFTIRASNCDTELIANSGSNVQNFHNMDTESPDLAEKD